MHFFKTFLFAWILSGCAVTPTMPPQSKIDRLTSLLASLAPDVPKEESQRLSMDIFRETKQLTEEFKLTSPPLWHNFLVNIGLRKKGLCFQWSDALYTHLNHKGYTHFSFHLVGANIGEYFFEHNALVIIPKGGKIEEGVVIDPWRNSGELYFSKVKDDTAYHWVHRTDRGCK